MIVPSTRLLVHVREAAVSRPAPSLLLRLRSVRSRSLHSTPFSLAQRTVYSRSSCKFHHNLNHSLSCPHCVASNLHSKSHSHSQFQRLLLQQQQQQQQHSHPFSTTSFVRHGDSPRVSLDDPNALKLTFITPENDEITVGAKAGQSLLDVAHANDIDLEGACEGSLACSTCHVVVVDPQVYESLEEPTDEENDMLDLAFGLTETSRLGCQVLMSKELDGLVVRIPSATRNLSQEKMN